MGRDSVLSEIASFRRRRNNVRARDLEDIAELTGWQHDRTTGSHKMYVKEGFRSLPIPQHSGALPGILVLSILKAIEESVQEAEEPGEPNNGRQGT